MNIKPQIDLLLVNARTDTGGGNKCAQFLLSLWDGRTYRVDLQDLLNVDESIFDAMRTILVYFYTNNKQLDQYLTEQDILPVIKLWGDTCRK